jgi:hypothetical protein
MKIGDLALVENRWYVVEQMDLEEGAVLLMGKSGHTAWVRWIDIDAIEVTGSARI